MHYYILYKKIGTFFTDLIGLNSELFSDIENQPRLNYCCM